MIANLWGKITILALAVMIGLFLAILIGNVSLIFLDLFIDREDPCPDLSAPVCPGPVQTFPWWESSLSNKSLALEDLGLCNCTEFDTGDTDLDIHLSCIECPPSPSITPSTDPCGGDLYCQKIREANNHKINKTPIDTFRKEISTFRGEGY